MYRNAGAFIFFDLGFRPFRTSWFIVGNCTLLTLLPVFVTRQTCFLVVLKRNIRAQYSTTEAIETNSMASELVLLYNSQLWFIQFISPVTLRVKSNSALYHMYYGSQTLSLTSTRAELFNFSWSSTSCICPATKSVAYSPNCY